MNWWMEKMESFRKEASEAFQMDISDCIFFVFSMGVTIVHVFVFTFMPGILGEKLAGTEFMWPQVPMKIAGVEFTWSLLGYNVLRDASGAVLIGGGLGYFISYEVGSFVAQCIKFSAAEKCYI